MSSEPLPGCYHPVKGSSRLAISPPLPGPYLQVSGLHGAYAVCVVGSRAVSIGVLMAKSGAITVQGLLLPTRSENGLL